MPEALKIRIGQIVDVVLDGKTIDKAVVLFVSDTKIKIRSKKDEELVTELVFDPSLESKTWKVVFGGLAGEKCTNPRGDCYQLVLKPRLQLNIPDELWYDLAVFLNLVADEREQDSEGPGSMPSDHARTARKILRELGMERIMGPGVR
jgi:hypothetical protein